MSFLRGFADSVYSPAAYAEMPSRGIGVPLARFFILILAFTIIRVVVWTGPLVSEVGGSIRSVVAEQMALYPNDLVVDIRNGRASVNQPEPLAIPAAEAIARETDLKNLLVVDTKTPFSGAQFSRYSTFAWLGRDAVFVRDNNDMRTFDLSAMEPVSLAKADLEALATTLDPYYDLIGPTIALCVFVGIFVGGCLRLAYLVLLALVIWILAAMLGRRIGYGASYKIGLSALVLPLTVELLVDLTRVRTGFGGFPFMFSLLTLAVVFGNLRGRSRSPVPAAVA